MKVKKFIDKKKIFRFSLDNIEPPNEQLEEEWQNQISENLSRLLQGLDESTVEKSNVCPFDALSDVPIDDQRFLMRFFCLCDYVGMFSITAVARIQHALRTNKLDEAIALFRASR